MSLTRLWDERLNPEEAADRYDPDDPLVGEILRIFHERASRISGEASGVEVENALRAYVDQWEGFARAPLRYGWRQLYDESRPPPSDVLLRAAEGGLYGHWPTPGSLREVEEMSRIYLRRVDGGGS